MSLKGRFKLVGLPGCDFRSAVSQAHRCLHPVIRTDAQRRDWGALSRLQPTSFLPVPDLLFDEELIDLGRYSRQDLLVLGLRAESLDREAVEMTIIHHSKRLALMPMDSFALALASRQGWYLLTDDRIIRNIVQSEGMPCRDGL